jgi:hypothetical protein
LFEDELMDKRTYGHIAFGGISLFCALVSISQNNYIYGIIGMFTSFFWGMGIGLPKETKK